MTTEDPIISMNRMIRRIENQRNEYCTLLKIVLKFTDVTGHVPKEAITEIRNTLKKYGEDV